MANGQKKIYKMTTLHWIDVIENTGSNTIDIE